ncbi:hypothetical protein [Castellaniella sp.]|uniref:hypothetical protein n=1 Tax=Castellaniella sp. TaxID=1955812 RepID=UPI002AFDCFDA|nr:hypothetical protein [Castellaniella sp.]
MAKNRLKTKAVDKPTAQQTYTQNQLSVLIGRRHPDYVRLADHWDFLEQTYSGGRDWFNSNNIFQYYKEGNKEFQARIKRAYRFNHTREVVDLVDKYLFKMPIERATDAPEHILRFWENATLDGKNIRDLMKQISNKTSRKGRHWIVVDTNKGASITTIADEKASNTRVYAYVVDPENAIDMSYDDSGELIWILIHEQVRDDADPMNSTGAMIDRFRLWERNQSTVFTVMSGQQAAAGVRAATNAIAAGKIGDVGTIDPGAVSAGEIRVHVGDPIAHGFGAVPVFAADHVISDELYWSPSMIDDVAYLDRAVANYLSNLDAIIQDQTFSQLVIPAGGIPDSDGVEEDEPLEKKMIALGTSRIFTFNADAGGKPEFISPDVKQAELILAAVNKIVAEIYHTTGLSGERTKDDNSQGIDNSSGVAKAYDFERVNSMLAAKADSLELVEAKLVKFVARWSGVDLVEGKRYVSYPDNFDVRGLRDEFNIASNLSLIGAPDTVRRQQMITLIDKLFPQLSDKLLAAMKTELKAWPPEPVETPSGSSQPQNDFKKAAANSAANKAVKQST